jgi:cytochrome c2
VQQTPGVAGTPGAGAAPGAGAPAAGTPEEAAATPGSEAPAERVAGENAPPQQPPGEASQTGDAAADTTAAQPGANDAGSQAAAQPETQAGQQTDAAAPQSGTAAAPAENAEPAASQEGDTQQLAAGPSPAAAAGAGGATGFAGGDAAEGEKLFRRCAACHKLEEGKHGVGPSLYGVVGREVGSLADYKYSDAMASHGGVWTPEQLSAYLENPKEVVPGTKMAFAGLKDPQDRIDIITYLNEADGTPEPLQ